MDYALYAQNVLAFVPEEVVGVPPSLRRHPNTRSNAAAVDLMRCWASALTDDTEDDYDADIEVPPWTLTEMLQYFRIPNRTRGSLPCHDQREGQYNALQLTEHSMHRVLERIIVGACNHAKRMEAAAQIF